MKRIFLVVTAALSTTAVSREANAEITWGTFVNNFNLEWSPVTFEDGTSSDGTLYSPYSEYLDQANRSWIDIPIEQFLGYLPGFSSPYGNIYTTENFPLPLADSPPYGGVLAYYKNADNGSEGMIVGLDSAYVPSAEDNFDTLFGPTEGSMFGISEADAIAILKSPVPGTSMTAHYVFETMVILQPEIMPRWSFDSLSNRYSLSMNLFAFSTPQWAGSSTSSGTFTPIVPEPASLWMATQLVVVGLGYRYSRRIVCRRSRN